MPIIYCPDCGERIIDNRCACTQPACLDGPEGCSGPVEYRMALSSTGRNFPRCEHHWEERLAEQERITRDYPDSPSPPDWFDPAAAGEAWDE